MSHVWVHHHLFRLIAIGFAISTLLLGCKEEVTRKADWETHFTDLHFVNAKLGWIVGLEGLIIHTDDSGLTWKKQKLTQPVTLRRYILQIGRYGMGSR